MLYRAENLLCRAGGRRILDIEHFEIEAGRIYGLLGANGAGKTTLLNILAFLDRPDSGTLEFVDRPVHFTAAQMSALRREVVMVDQHPVLFSTTVQHNIEFGLKIRGIAGKERDEIIDRVLEMVDLQGLRQAPAQGLSGGEIQRIALARALALSPRVLLCDEPTSSVDVENQAAIAALLRRVNTDGRVSIIFTTHDRLQAAALTDEILVLDRGRVVTTGYENIFVCTLEQQGKTGILCRLSDRAVFELPALATGLEPGRQRIFIDPAGIDLVREGGSLSGRSGLLQGRVMQLMDQGNRIRMVVDIGVMLVVYLDFEKYLARPPRVGGRVLLRVRPEAVQV